MESGGFGLADGRAGPAEDRPPGASWGSGTLLRAIPTREPAAQRTDHQPNLGGQGDVGGQADDDAEGQSGHRADRDRESDAHAGESMSGSGCQRAGLCCVRCAGVGVG